MRFQEKAKRDNARAAADQKQTVDKSSRAKQLCVSPSPLLPRVLRTSLTHGASRSIPSSADQKAKLEARRAKAQKGERRG